MTTVVETGTAQPINLNSDYFSMGRIPSYSGGFFYGLVNNVMMHNIELSSQEVKQNYDALKGRFQ